QLDLRARLPSTSWLPGDDGPVLGPLPRSGHARRRLDAQLTLDELTLLHRRVEGEGDTQALRIDAAFDHVGRRGDFLLGFDGADRAGDRVALSAGVDRFPTPLVLRREVELGGRLPHRLVAGELALDRGARVVDELHRAQGPRRDGNARRPARRDV